jgi:hypothetical protein
MSALIIAGAGFIAVVLLVAILWLTAELAAGNGRAIVAFPFSDQTYFVLDVKPALMTLLAIETGVLCVFIALLQ